MRQLQHWCHSVHLVMEHLGREYKKIRLLLKKRHITSKHQYKKKNKKQNRISINQMMPTIK